MRLFSKRKSDSASKENKKSSTSSQGSGSRPSTRQTSSTQATSSSISIPASTIREPQVSSKPAARVDTPQAANRLIASSHKRDASSSTIGSHSGALNPTKHSTPTQQQSVSLQAYGQGTEDIALQLRDDLEEEHYDLSADLFNCHSVPKTKRILVISEIYLAIFQQRAIIDQQFSKFFDIVHGIKVADSQLCEIRDRFKKFRTFNEQSFLDEYLIGCCLTNLSSDRKQRRNRLERRGCAPITPIDFLGMVLVCSLNEWRKSDTEQRSARMRQWAELLIIARREDSLMPIPISLSADMGQKTLIHDEIDHHYIDMLGFLTDSLDVPPTCCIIVFAHVYLAKCYAPEITAVQLSSFFKVFYPMQIDPKTIVKMRRRIDHYRDCGNNNKQLAECIKAASYGSASLMKLPIQARINFWHNYEKATNDWYFLDLRELERQLSNLEWRGKVGLFGPHVP